MSAVRRSMASFKGSPYSPPITPARTPGRDMDRGARRSGGGDGEQDPLDPLTPAGAGAPTRRDSWKESVTRVPACFLSQSHCSVQVPPDLREMGPPVEEVDDEEEGWYGGADPLILTIEIARAVHGMDDLKFHDNFLISPKTEQDRKAWVEAFKAELPELPLELADEYAEALSGQVGLSSPTDGLTVNSP